jgi:gamma-glutamylcyclotransferase (GGCT)/AIG2-like uncharacterized protein YtfP
VPRRTCREADVNLFVYGTLRDPAQVRRLTGRQFVTQPAVLRGYRRCEPPGSYAYITPDPSSEVHGQILRNVDAAAVQAFDAYEDEGRLYRRVAVWVTLAGGDEPAEAYVARAPVPRSASEQA